MFNIVYSKENFIYEIGISVYAMSNYKIKLWQSKATEEYCENNGYESDEALQRAKTYIEGAFGYVDHAGADVSLGSKTIYAPTEKVLESFEAYSPCYELKMQYDYLLHWWDEELSCEVSESEADDSNILITADNTSGGGYSQTSTDGNLGTASIGEFLPQVSDSYQEYIGTTDSDSEWGSISTLLHEIGHNILEGGTNHHNRGVTNYSRSVGGWCYSPVGSNVGDTNECEQDQENDLDGRMLYYGGCAQCVMTKSDGDSEVCN